MGKEISVENLREFAEQYIEAESERLGSEGWSGGSGRLGDIKGGANLVSGKEGRIYG